MSEGRDSGWLPRVLVPVSFQFPQNLGPWADGASCGMESDEFSRGTHTRAVQHPQPGNNARMWRVSLPSGTPGFEPK